MIDAMPRWRCRPLAPPNQAQYLGVGRTETFRRSCIHNGVQSWSMSERPFDTACRTRRWSPPLLRAATRRSTAWLWRSGGDAVAVGVGEGHS